jgi:hypothetical protein
LRIERAVSGEAPIAIGDAQAQAAKSNLLETAAENAAAAFEKSGSAVSTPP